MRKIILAIFIVVGAGFALETETIETITLDNIVSVGSKVPTEIEQAPGNTTVVDKKQINQTPNYRFTDTLRGEEGIIQPKGRGMETFDSVMIRGISGGALLMVDGVPLNDINNNTKMLTTMRAHDLERIEVVRGASSVLYGSGGLSGAVNFITRMPTELEVYGSIGYGNPFDNKNAPQDYTQWYLSAGDAFLNKRLRAKVTYGGSFSNGYAADSAWTSSNSNGGNGGNGGITGYIQSQNTSGGTIYIVGDMGEQKFNTHDVRAKLEYDVSDNGVFSAWVNYSNYNYIHHNQTSFLKDSSGNAYYGNGSCNNSSSCTGTLPYAFVGGMGNEDYHQVIVASNYRHFFEENELYTSISYLYGNDSWGGPLNANNSTASVYGGSGSLNNTIYNMVNFEAHFNLNLTDSHSLIFGAQEKLLTYGLDVYNMSDWRNLNDKGALTSSKGGNHNFVGVFIDWRAQWLDNLSSTLGVRADVWNGFGYYSSNSSGGDNVRFEPSPKASLNYTAFKSAFAKTIFKASFGRSFRAPTFNQMFREYTYNDGTKIAGNPNLKPEVLNSYDIGVEQSFGLGSRFSGLVKLYYFDSFFENAITLVSDTYTNAQKARINGIEFAYHQKFWDSFGARLTYTWSNARLTQDLDSIKAGNYLPNVPEHSAYAQVYYDKNKFLASLGLEIASKQYKSLDNSSQKVWGVYGSYDAYYLLDMRLGYKISKHFEVSANFTNLLDYEYYAYYKAPGRAFYIEIASKL